MKSSHTFWWHIFMWFKTLPLVPKHHLFQHARSCYYCWHLLPFHGCYFQSHFFWRNNTRKYAQSFMFWLNVFFSEFSLLSPCLCASVHVCVRVCYSQPCCAFSEAPRTILRTPSKHWWLFWIGVASWFPWSRGIWVQWSFCSSTYTHHRICTWSGL